MCRKKKETMVRGRRHICFTEIDLQKINSDCQRLSTKMVKIFRVTLSVFLCCSIDQE